MKIAVVTKNNGNHIFGVGQEIEIMGGIWLTDQGDLSTPDGNVPAHCFVVVDESDLKKTTEFEHWVHSGWM
jgi:hypothetical protein